MKILRIILTAAALHFTASGDTPAKPPVLSPPRVDAADAERKADEAKKNYQRGVQFAKGEGVPLDYSVAARFYRLSAEAGYAPAQYNLADLYVKGLGVEQAPKQAAIWYRKAAEQGDAEAQNNLGALYATGQGVARNDAEAVRWYRLAAEQNDPEGTSNLGMMCLQGRAVKRDFARAFQLLQKAAEQGYAAAQNNLALMYANDQGVARDYVWAYAWLDLAAAQISESADLRDRIVKMMPVGRRLHAHVISPRESAKSLDRKEQRPNDRSSTSMDRTLSVHGRFSGPSATCPLGRGLRGDTRYRS